MKLSFSSLKKKSVLLLCHDHADLDSFCSAVIMHNLLSAKKIPSTIAVPSHINNQSIAFAQKNKISFISNPDLSRFDEIFLFDFNSYEQLGSLSSRFIELYNSNAFDLMVFDHHVLEDNSISKSKETICNDCFSTTELLFRLFGNDDDFGKLECFFVCVGLVEDTGRFLVGDEKAFDVFSKCLKRSGKRFSDVLSFTNQKIPVDERTAFLRAAQRSQLIPLRSKLFSEKILIVTSILSFYQSDSASMLLTFGADICLVAGTEKDSLTTLSARADSVFKDKYNFNLVNDLLISLKASLGGEIGGHSGAAQWKGKADARTVLDESVSILRKLLAK